MKKIVFIIFLLLIVFFMYKFANKDEYYSLPFKKEEIVKIDAYLINDFSNSKKKEIDDISLINHIYSSLDDKMIKKSNEKIPNGEKIVFHFFLNSNSDYITIYTPHSVKKVYLSLDEKTYIVSSDIKGLYKNIDAPEVAINIEEFREIKDI